MDSIQINPTLVGWISASVAIAYCIYVQRQYNKKKSDQDRFDRGQINCMINLDCPKVADTVFVEDLGMKKSFCRCWASKKWPFCDHAHSCLNRELKDNAGELKLRSKHYVSKKKDRKDKPSKDKSKKQKK